MVPDDEVLIWLMNVTTYALQLHHGLTAGKSMPPAPGMRQTGPTIEEQHRAREAFDEGFARWMGWRGQAAQEQEIRAKRQPKAP